MIYTKNLQIKVWLQKFTEQSDIVNEILRTETLFARILQTRPIFSIISQPFEPPGSTSKGSSIHLHQMTMCLI